MSAEPLVPMVDGNAKIISWTEELILDASESYDPNYAVKTSLNHNWTCTFGYNGTCTFMASMHRHAPILRIPEKTMRIDQ